MRQLIVLVIMGSVLIFLALIIPIQETAAPQSGSGSSPQGGGFDAIVSFSNGAVVHVEIANTTGARQVGLMNHQGLGEKEGMLLDFMSIGSHGIWMMNMKFSIDAIWVNTVGIVVHVEENLQPCSSNPGNVCPAYYSKASNVRYVLEVPAGFAARRGIAIGDDVEIATIQKQVG